MSFTAERARQLSEKEKIRWSRVKLAKILFNIAARKGEKSCGLYFKLNETEIQKLEKDGFICHHRHTFAGDSPDSNYDCETEWYW